MPSPISIIDGSISNVIDSITNSDSNSISSNKHLSSKDNADHYAAVTLNKGGSLQELQQKRDYFISQQRQELNAIEYAEHMADCVVDYTTIYCSQTGQPIGKRDEDGIKAALALHKNVNKIKDVYEDNNNIPIDVILTPDYKWLVTDGERLAKLKYIDPYGFYMYTINLLTRRNNAGYSNKHNNWIKRQAQREHNIALIQGYQLLTKTDMNVILTANDRLAKLVDHMDILKGEDGEKFGDDPLGWTTPNMVAYIPILAHGFIQQLIKRTNKLPQEFNADPKFGLSNLKSANKLDKKATRNKRMAKEVDDILAAAFGKDSGNKVDLSKQEQDTVAIKAAKARKLWAKQAQDKSESKDEDKSKSKDTPTISQKWRQASNSNTNPNTNNNNNSNNNTAAQKFLAALRGNTNS